MDLENLIVFAVIGIVAGWLAGQLLKGRGFGLLGNLVVGVIGAFIGGILFNLAGITSDNLLESLIAAVIGAVVLLLVIGALRKT